jgi:hypothetical protein
MPAERAPLDAAEILAPLLILPRERRMDMLAVAVRAALDSGALDREEVGHPAEPVGSATATELGGRWCREPCQRIAEAAIPEQAPSRRGGIMTTVTPAERCRRMWLVRYGKHKFCRGTLRYHFCAAGEVGHLLTCRCKCGAIYEEERPDPAPRPWHRDPT